LVFEGNFDKIYEGGRIRMGNTAIKEFDLLCTSRKSFQERAEGLIKLLGGVLKIEKVAESKGDDLCFYVMDMSNYRMKVSSRTLLVIPNPAVCREGIAIEGIIDKIKETINRGIPEERLRGYPENFREQITFLFCLGDGRIFRPLYQDPLYNIFVLGKEGLSKLIGAESPREVFIETIKEHLSISKMSPYRFLGPVGEEMFYGRKREIDSILGSEKDFAVVGSRGTGKTSFLEHLYRITNKGFIAKEKEKGGSPIVHYSCLGISDDAPVTEGIIKRINIKEIGRWERGRFSLRDFFRRMYRWHGCKLILFLDEVDDLVASTQGKLFFSEIRAASDQGYLRVVISGYKQLFADVFDKKTTFYNFLEPLRLKELEREAAKRLILEPMKELGISFKEEKRIVDYLLEQSGCYPRIIQFYCQHLIEHIEEKGRDVITIDDVYAVEESEDIVNHLVDVFMETVTEIEQLLVYLALGLPKRFRTEELHQRLNQRLESKGLSAKLKRVEKEIRHLELSNIFERRGNELWFSYQILPQLLRRYYDIDYRIDELIGDEDIISILKGYF
jgi:hypothetical protein